METAFFGVKRLHWRVVAITGRLLEPSTLTPARFDLMRILALRPEGIIQRNIVLLLGVSAPVVSRILKALERAGTVVRTRWERDRRCKLVRITDLGTELVGRAFAETLDPRVGEHMVATLVADRRHPDIDDESLRAKVAALEDGIVRARGRLHDTSPVRHPWKSDDILSMMETALVHDREPPPLFDPTYFPPEQYGLTTEEIGLLWDPPPGYVPPDIDSGLLP